MARPQCDTPLVIPSREDHTIEPSPLVAKVDLLWRKEGGSHNNSLPGLWLP